MSLLEVSVSEASPALEDLLSGLRAVAEPTRLRILALCSLAELSVNELVQILGQSQPRVSRHLKLMVEAGVLERSQEGSRAFYRPVEAGPVGALAGKLIDLMPQSASEIAGDVARLETIKRERTERAERYFAANAQSWEDLRGLYADDAAIDARLASLVAERPGGDLLDIGTGTGRVLEAVAPFVKSAVGVDNARPMLDIARAKLDDPHFQHVRVRQADMYRLPFPAARFDTVTVNMVLRYAEAPAGVLAEAARVLRPGGRVFVVDFAPHDMEELRERHAHRWLGFSDEDITDLAARAGLGVTPAATLDGSRLAVRLWLARPVANDSHLAMAQGGQA